MESARDDILRIQNMTVELGKKIILDRIEINVKEEDMLGIVGVSGAGKTTLLNSMIGFYPLQNGDVLYNSPRANRFISIFDNLSNFKRLFGFSAQNPSFYPELSVKENLVYFANLYSLPENIKKQNIKRALQLVQLEDFHHMQAKNLSGGMQKRLDIACAIVHNPKILILDEPTSDMDPLLRVQMWGLIEDINKSGTTIIVASHFLSEIEHICDKIVFLHNKKVELTCTPRYFRSIYSRTKEIHIATKDRKYDVVLRKIMYIPFLEVKHILKKKGRLILHSNESENTINSALNKLLKTTSNISNIEVKNPSMDMLFKIFMEK